MSQRPKRPELMNVQKNRNQVWEKESQRPELMNEA